MQVDAVAALAPVLARFAIVVDGPLEAEVLGRIVAGGDRATTLADLARPFPGRPDLARPDAVAVARGLVTRLLAGGTLEHVGGGYRIADPVLSAHLRTVLDGLPTPGARHPVAGTAGVGTALPAATVPGGVSAASEDASRLLQQVLAARAMPLPPPSPAAPLPVVPPAWEGLVGAGWVPQVGTGAATGATTSAVLASSSGTPVVARVVVGDPSSPPAAVAARLGAVGPTHLAHVVAPPVAWGDVDAETARAAADALGRVLAGPVASRTPLLADRALVPALVTLARDGALPGVVLVDLRSGAGRALAAPPAPAGPVEPSVLAAAMAAAAGVSAPARRSSSRPRRGGDLASLLEVLFGPRCAAELVGDAEPTQHVAADPAAVPGTSSGGVVVTARTDDPHADALGALLGVEVLHLGPHDDLLPEVLAWLEDEHGRRLLAPQA